MKSIDTPGIIYVNSDGGLVHNSQPSAPGFSKCCNEKNSTTSALNSDSPSVTTLNAQCISQPIQKRWGTMHEPAEDLGHSLCEHMCGSTPVALPSYEANDEQQIMSAQVSSIPFLSIDSTLSDIAPSDPANSCTVETRTIFKLCEEPGDEDELRNPAKFYTKLGIEAWLAECEA